MKKLLLLLIISWCTTHSYAGQRIHWSDLHSSQDYQKMNLHELQQEKKLMLKKLEDMKMQTPPGRGRLHKQRITTLEENLQKIDQIILLRTPQHTAPDA